MPVIDPQGLFDGDRLAACSDRAKVFWPFLYCASNGYARLEINTIQIRKKCFSGFLSPPQDCDIIEVLREYANNFLVIVYEYEGKQWLQFDTSSKYLPKHKSKKDNESPAPTAEELKEFMEGYINWKSTKSLNLQLFPKISENFGKIRENVRGIGIGIGIGVGTGIGVGVGNTETDLPIFEDEDRQGEEVKSEKLIALHCQTILRTNADLSENNKFILKTLDTVHKGSVVARAFEVWAREHKYDEIRRPVAAFLKEADELLSVEGPAAVEEVENPVVKAVGREIAYRTDNLVALDARAKRVLTPAVEEFEYTAEEVMLAWREFFQNLDTSRPNALAYAAKNFSEEAADRLYAVRRKAEEKAQEATAVAAASQKMVRDAEEERSRRIAELKKEQEAVEEELPD